ncbi:MAG: hypothetical protein LBH20_06495 [Treponema sp.]|jgi:hypothetical protein|nr:hypothetical protein [Treponema sp.]
MQGFLQILSFIIIGAALLWFGFSLFIGQWTKFRSKYGKPQQSASSGDFQACPICSSRLNKGDLVKTLAFPSITGGKDRLMHIRGCLYCVNGGMKRKCPVCDAALSLSDILVARIFERPHRRPHVHITGCNKCRRTGAL